MAVPLPFPAAPAVGQTISLIAVAPALQLPRPLTPAGGKRLPYLVSVESTAASVPTKAVPSSSVTAGSNARRLAIRSLLADYPSALSLHPVDFGRPSARLSHKSDRLVAAAVDELHAKLFAWE